ncbi:unnamed protein product [Prorocentrum cordatum]|uniref:Ribosomal protein n=1 Tax=Prorocentrum cordatum TaxID=2364126 RepID=A0ABN9YCY7_9DINO|nr:unnamed protein product [Polarella glacialis]
MLIHPAQVRTKKWKPFHNMHRANKLREIRQKQQADAAQAAAEAAAEAAAAGGTSARTVRPNEPTVATTPFQATRLMRAFDVFPEKGASVSLWTRLNVDLTRESVRGTCHLPHGLDTKIRILAFCADDEVQEMLAAGADMAGITEPLRRINLGNLDFDRCIATPSVMPQVMKVSKILGPRKMMPNPKSGTVVTNLKQAIKEAKGGTLLEFRAEGQGELQATIADAGFADAKILENMKFFVQSLLRARPRGSTGGKGKGEPLIPGKSGGDEKDIYFLEATLRLGSAGPPVRVDPESMLPTSVGYFR